MAPRLERVRKKRQMIGSQKREERRAKLDGFEKGEVPGSRSRPTSLDKSLIAGEHLTPCKRPVLDSRIAPSVPLTQDCPHGQ